MTVPAEGSAPWPQSAYALAALSPASRDLVTERLASGMDCDSLGTLLADLVPILTDTFDEENRAEVLRDLFSATDAGKRIDILSATRWLRAHRNDPQSFAQCLSVNPPAEIEIERLLSTKGSQKRVFLGDWRDQKREVVLKQFLNPAEAEKLLGRERLTFPLTMKHDNIVETYYLNNSEGETFLVEERLDVLGDSWQPGGLEDIANLLTNITEALRFLGDHNYVHGDIKLDNIGRKDGRFILLDFGLCKKADELTPETTPTGSLRTRAPEMLLGTITNSPKALDIWAIGATVFYALKGRYPLFYQGENVHRVSKPEERAAQEAELVRRVNEDYDAFVEFEDVSKLFIEVLENMLARDPRQRCTAQAAVSKAHELLQAYIKSPPSLGGLTPMEELDQLLKFLPKDALPLLPRERRDRLSTRLKSLRAMPVCDERKPDIDQLLMRIDAGVHD